MSQYIGKRRICPLIIYNRPAHPSGDRVSFLLILVARSNARGRLCGRTVPGRLTGAFTVKKEHQPRNKILRTDALVRRQGLEPWTP